MKLVCFGDLHAHMFNEFAKVDDITGNSRFTNIIKYINSMEEYCKDNKVDCVLFSGDLFHQRKSVNTTVFNKTFDAIHKLAQVTKVYLLVGNHDMEDNSDNPSHSLDVFKYIPNVFVLDTLKTYEIVNDELIIFPIPYTKNVEAVKEAIDYYEQLAQGTPFKSVLLFHLGVSGAYVGNTNYAMKDTYSIQDLKPNSFTYGVGGHYHKFQFLGGTENFFYTGSPLQHNFGDEDNLQGFIVIDTETDELIYEEYESPKFITVKKASQSNGLEGNFVRFQIPAEDVAKLEDNVSEDLQYRIEPIKDYKVEMRVDISHKMTNAKIIENYCDQFNKEAKKVLLDIIREVEET